MRRKSNICVYKWHECVKSAEESRVEMSKGGSLQKDVPWRASSSSAKPIPRIHHSPLLRVSRTPVSDYGISVMRHPDPIGGGLGDEATVEPAGPDCLVPGQKMPIQLLGLQVSFFFFLLPFLFSIYVLFLPLVTFKLSFFILSLSIILTFFRGI